MVQSCFYIFQEPLHNFGIKLHHLQIIPNPRQDDIIIIAGIVWVVPTYYQS